MKHLKNIFAIATSILVMGVAISAEAAPSHWKGDYRYPFVDQTENAYIFLNGTSIKVLRVPEEGHQPFDIMVSLVAVSNTDQDMVFERPQIKIRFFPYNEHAKDKFMYDEDGFGFKTVYFTDMDEHDLMVFRALGVALQYLKDHES